LARFESVFTLVFENSFEMIIAAVDLRIFEFLA